MRQYSFDLKHYIVFGIRIRNNLAFYKLFYDLVFYTETEWLNYNIRFTTDTCRTATCNNSGLFLNIAPTARKSRKWASRRIPCQKYRSAKSRKPTFSEYFCQTRSSLRFARADLSGTSRRNQPRRVGGINMNHACIFFCQNFTIFHNIEYSANLWIIFWQILL